MKELFNLEMIIHFKCTFIYFFKMAVYVIVTEVNFDTTVLSDELTHSLYNDQSIWRGDTFAHESALVFLSLFSALPIFLRKLHVCQKHHERHKI